MQPPVPPRLPTAMLLLGAALTLAAAGAASAAPGDAQLGVLPLDGVQRLLVLAPHCDDETLGSGGLIQQVLAQRGEVRVVLATNGDGFTLAAMEEFRRLYPRHEDYVHMGEIRQQESLDALAILGVGPQAVSFLGYPDRGTPSLWNEHWSAALPYRSPFSGDSRSPYARTYDPGSVYAGEDYLADLLSILRVYGPDLVVLPHPNDVHPDHWGLGVFGRLAVALLEQERPGYHPAVYSYLVHRHDFPEPKGLRPESSLLPPPPLLELDSHLQWLSLPLSPEQIDRKQQAVQAYRSQLPALRELLESFVRRNELFQTVEVRALPRLDEAGTLLDPSSWRSAEASPASVQPVQRDPVGDVLARRLLRSGDLLAIYAGLMPDGSLRVCAGLDGHAAPELRYLLGVTAFGPQGRKHWEAESGRPRPGRLRLQMEGSVVGLLLPAAEFGRPRFLLLEAEVLEPELGSLDRSAWCLLSVGSP
jgi:LmbE family N-acetylglucosaminyl deacetylase